MKEKWGKRERKEGGGGFEARLNLNLRGLSQLFLSLWCQRKKLRVLLMSGWISHCLHFLASLTQLAPTAAPRHRFPPHLHFLLGQTGQVKNSWRFALLQSKPCLTDASQQQLALFLHSLYGGCNATGGINSFERAVVPHYKLLVWQWFHKNNWLRILKIFH